MIERSVSFQWHPGMAKSQSQKSIDSLHSAARMQFDLQRILEISSKSRDELGVCASAFNLQIKTVRNAREFSVESAYQASKVFENGGPYADLLDVGSREARADPRLRSSGRLIAFQFYGDRWKLLPRRAFYDWLYVQALSKQPEIANKIVEYQAFTDIAFNPEKSINCQAHAAALYVSLFRKGLVDEVLDDTSMFLRAFAGEREREAVVGDEIQRGMKFD
ncbi:MAG TPA: hypothetical protein VMF52_12505 [Steroidobacteraceae bacterium]|nr:hypothetical protein [Steroidobacteraceae bacterium]